MAITPEDIQHIARFGRDRPKILEYIDQLREVDICGIAPQRQYDQRRNCFREDRVSPSLSRNDTLANTPDARDGIFRVPRVIG
jgi:aspartyl-tRNA(Asn)/glutamyl-tRNA(Gln) amidotransferase subunit C